MYQARISRRRRAALAAASLGLGLAAVSFNSYAGAGDTDCPGSPSQPPFDPPPQDPTLPGFDPDFDDLMQQLLPPVQPQVQPPQLLPGKNRATPGAALAAHQQGPAIINESIPFSFAAHDGRLVSGVLIQKVVNAHDCTCDYYWQIKMDAWSAWGVNGLVLNQFMHPTHQLYGNYRSDTVPLGIPSDHVKRSPGIGDTITFNVGAIVQPSQVSRQLLLDTAVGVTHKAGSVQLRAADGTLSAPIPAWVPSWP
jgi:hypothetical protein